MNEPATFTETRRREWERAINVMVQQMRAEGYTINLEQIPLDNIPRMGDYGQRVTVHLGRELYRGGKS